MNNDRLVVTIYDTEKEEASSFKCESLMLFSVTSEENDDMNILSKVDARWSGNYSAAAVLLGRLDAMFLNIYERYYGQELEVEKLEEFLENLLIKEMENDNESESNLSSCNCSNCRAAKSSRQNQGGLY